MNPTENLSPLDRWQQDLQQLYDTKICYCCISARGDFLSKHDNLGSVPGVYNDPRSMLFIEIINQSIAQIQSAEFSSLKPAQKVQIVDQTTPFLDLRKDSYTHSYSHLFLSLTSLFVFLAGSLLSAEAASEYKGAGNRSRLFINATKIAIFIIPSLLAFLTNRLDSYIIKKINDKNNVLSSQLKYEGYEQDKVTAQLEAGRNSMVKTMISGLKNEFDRKRDTIFSHLVTLFGNIIRSRETSDTTAASSGFSHEWIATKFKEISNPNSSYFSAITKTDYNTTTNAPDNESISINITPAIFEISPIPNEEGKFKCKHKINFEAVVTENTDLSLSQQTLSLALDFDLQLNDNYPMITNMEFNWIES